MPDYYTSQFSGEEIDEALRSAKTITDAASGDEIASSVKWRTNPNLLDNWHFGRPVNQRGVTSLASGNWEMHFIDRWLATSPDNAYAITDDGIKISNLQHKYSQIWRQNLERMEKRTYTLSFLLKSIGLLSMTFTPQDSNYIEQTLDGGFVVSFTSEADLANPGIRLLECASTTVSDVTILAAKLELGDQQTLAHQENGAWVLNEVPDYGEQLRRCLAYAVDFAPNSGVGIVQNDTTAYLYFPLTVPLRSNAVKPALKIDYPCKAWTSKGETNITNIALNGTWNGGNMICLTYVGDFSGVTPGSVISSYFASPFLTQDL